MKNQKALVSSKKKNNSPASNQKSIIQLYIIIAVLVGIIIFSLIFYCMKGKKESVTIQSFSPIEEVQQTTNFTITFSKEVIDDSLVNVWLDKAPIAFDPVIPGKFQWIERNKIRFYPDVLLQPSTEYTANISARLVSDHGYSLRGNRSFKFHTPRFKVNSASLTFEFIPDTDKEAKLKSTIEFNYEVNPEEAVKHTSIQYKDGGMIPFKLITSSPGTIIELEAEKVERGEQEKEIQLKIAEGLIPIGGNQGLLGDFIQPITMPRQQDLKVERMSPRWDSPTSAYVQIQFNLPVDTKTAAQFITLDPALKYQIAASHHYLDLRGDFKIGSAYQVSIRKGLRAIDGSQLKKDFSSTINFRREDIPPQLDFVGEGFYLTKSGNLNIGLSTINVEKVTIEIDKIYINNLVYLLNQNDLAGNRGYYWYDQSALGKQVHSSELIIQKIHNEEVVTPINIKEFLADERLGIFNITARQTERRWQQASKWVLATDIGIVAKKAGDDLWIWVNSLSSLAPIPNAEIKLISQNNQALMTATTNTEGLAVLESYTRFKEEEFVPFLITASFGNDFSFLELTRRQIATSDFDVGGAAFLEHGYEAYLYNERGVYRPGETAHLAGIVRGENMTVPTPFPVVFQIKGPDEKILEEQRATLNEQGGVGLLFQFPITP